MNYKEKGKEIQRKGEEYPSFFLGDIILDVANEME